MSLPTETYVTSDFLDHNRQILRRRFRTLDEALGNAGNRALSSVRIQVSRSGRLTASVSRSAREVHVHSTYDPYVEAERWVRDVTSEAWDFAVIIGMGLGYHLEMLIKECPHRQLVVVEPDPDLFLAAMTARDLRKLLSHPHLHLIVTDDTIGAVDALFQQHGKALLQQQHFLIWPATSRYAPDFWTRFQRRAVDVLRSTRTTLATTQIFSTAWMDNFFANLEASLSDPGVSSLFPCFSGRPAIIASAGPSLETNVGLLRDVKGRAVIIAAGSTINPLLKHGVEPDLLVSFDAGKANYRHFEHLDSHKLPLVYIPTIFPRIIEKYKGPRFSASMDMTPYISWFYEMLELEKGTLTSGPSVANISWDLARRMGLGPIILVGQDLAYTGFRSHAEGAAHARTVEIDTVNNGKRYFEIEGVNGERLYTDRAMYSMKVWFENRLRDLSSAPLTIDATEGGAKIHGTQTMTLAEAIDRYCTHRFNPYDTIIEVHQSERSRLDRSDQKGRLRVVYQQLYAHLKTAEKLASGAVKDGKILKRECDTGRLTEQRYKEAVIRLERFMTELSKLPAYQAFILPITIHIVQSLTLSVQERWKRESDLNAKGKQLARQYLLLFDTVKVMSKHIAQRVRANQQN